MTKAKLLLELQKTENKKVISQHLLEKMLENIGSPDSELRETIYGHWHILLEEQRLSTEQKHWLWEKIQSQGLLFQGIEEKTSDQVFTRSFVSLLLVCLLSDDAENHWLSVQDVSKTFDMSFQYMRQEEDNRGFVAEKGWAHAFAHGGDLLASIAENPLCDSQDATIILELIFRAIFEVGHFLYEEETRLNTAIALLIQQQKLEVLDLQTWLASGNQHYRANESHEPDWARFLSSLYFKLESQGDLTADLALEMKKGIHFYYHL
jgi:hypothetical protein